jgi:hypothetical protein
VRRTPPQVHSRATPRRTCASFRQAVYSLARQGALASSDKPALTGSSKGTPNIKNKRAIRQVEDKIFRAVMPGGVPSGDGGGIVRFLWGFRGPATLGPCRRTGRRNNRCRFSADHRFASRVPASAIPHTY